MVEALEVEPLPPLLPPLVLEVDPLEVEEVLELFPPSEELSPPLLGSSPSPFTVKVTVIVPSEAGIAAGSMVLSP